MKWFNTTQFDPPTVIKARNAMGKRFIVTCPNGKYEAVYCQIHAGEFLFIGRDGNRIVDDNKEILSAKEIKS